VEYQGRARLGETQQSSEAIIRIAEVEEPQWNGVVMESGRRDLPDEEKEFPICLLEGIYREWTGSAVVTQGAGFEPLLQGRTPLTPPVGA
jgi:hypothetical protein